MTPQEIINTALQTIDIELDGINRLKQTIDQNFVEAINIIASIKGRVIVSGIGKSGHVAKKISATLASTGTPAFFVHPTEAIHGDLGMITEGDCIIIISNSGNSAEIFGMIDYCLVRNIAIIAITGNSTSVLSKAAKVVLLLPPCKEACPFNKAPTTSTTLSMVLGDCIALTLLHYKNFSCEDFKNFHPGGTLGASLKSLEEIMHIGKEVPLITSGSSMKEALLEITSKRFGCVGVVNEANVMIGIITDGDLRRHLSDNLLDLEVDKVMTKNFVATHKDQFASEALYLMHSQKITQLFVVDHNNIPIGIVHIHDLSNIL